MTANALPIRLYGDPVLRQRASLWPETTFEEAIELSKVLFSTLKQAGGLGLAAPQIGISRRLFVVDTTVLADAGKAPRIQIAFVNPQILQKSSELAEYEEGCLSIPGLHEPIRRPASIQLRYQGIDKQVRETHFDGWVARIIQHEYDHIEGILFLDHLSQLKRQLLKKKLSRIARGDVEVDYSVQVWSS